MTDLATLRLRALAAVAAVLGAAVLFGVAQNRYGFAGGPIAASKSLWLGIALVYWLVLPHFLAADPRLAHSARRPFRILLAVMLTRGVVEVYMLYVAKNWLPAYGIACNLLGLAIFAASAARAALWQGSPAVTRAHAAFTGALFVPECGYAWYMQSGFETRGADAVYFVPDDGAHALVLHVTATVDAIALAWLVAFLYLWLHAQAHRLRS